MHLSLGAGRGGEQVVLRAGQLVGAGGVAGGAGAFSHSCSLQKLHVLGVVLRELRVGELPFGRRVGERLVRAAMDRDIPGLAERLVAVPLPPTRMIDRLVRHSPADRPASAVEVRDVLESLAARYRAARRVVSPAFVADRFAGAGDVALSAALERELPATVPRGAWGYSA